MSCWTTPFDKNLESDYEDIDVTQEFTFGKNQNHRENLFTVDCKTILHSIPTDIFDLLKISINVCTSEKLLLQPCESRWVKTNIILKPYLPINCSFLFKGVINGYGVKSFNQTIIQLTEETLKVRLQNYNQVAQNIPVDMPIGQLVLNSKQFCDY